MREHEHGPKAKGLFFHFSILAILAILAVMAI